jgi:branched-chain amino acid transport system permease protein
MIYRFIRRTRDSTAALFLASLGIYITLQNSISLIWGDNTRTLRTAVVIERYELLGARVSSVQLAILASAGALVTVVVLVMKTPFGRDLRALANDPNLAAIRGLNSNRLVTGAVALASFLTGSAAILLYIEVDLTPSGGFKLLIMGMIAAILGGLRSFGGCVIGGTLLGLAQNVAVFFLPAKWQDAVAFLILVICLLLRPQGILGGVLRLPQHVRAE